LGGGFWVAQRFQRCDYDASKTMGFKPLGYLSGYKAGIPFHRHFIAALEALRHPKTSSNPAFHVIK